jgi:hypothetical protein
MKWLKLAEEEFCNEPDGARIALNSIEQGPRARLYSRKHIFFENAVVPMSNTYRTWILL